MPVLPFDPARAPIGNMVRVSLQDAYSDVAIRSFVRKLRQLADLAPQTCGAMFADLNDTLDDWVNTLRLRRRKVRHAAGAVGRLCALGKTGVEPVSLERLVNTLLPKLLQRRPAAVLVLDDIVADLLNELESHGDPERRRRDG
jgi:hypothetical protein